MKTAELIVEGVNVQSVHPTKNSLWNRIKCMMILFPTFLTDTAPVLDAWFTRVCTRCVCLLISVCATAELDRLELRICELCAIWLCLRLCAPQLCHQHHVCLFCAARAFFSFKCKEISSLVVSCRPICCKLSEPSVQGLFWTGVTPQYLLGSQLMALKPTGRVHCNATPSVKQCIHSHAGATNLLFRSAPAACFSFAVGNAEAWLKLGSLGHTCGLNVQFAKNIHPLFLTPKVQQGS